MVERFEPFSFSKKSVDLERISFDEVKKKEKPLIFDTNFLFVTFEFHIDIIRDIKPLLGSKVEFFIYEGTLDELKAVEKKGDKNKRFLPLILKMLNLYEFKVISSQKSYIDEQILDNLSEEVLVATNDKALRQEIQKKGFKVLYMRQKSYLEIS